MSLNGEIADKIWSFASNVTSNVTTGSQQVVGALGPLVDQARDKLLAANLPTPPDASQIFHRPPPPGFFARIGNSINNNRLTTAFLLGTAGLGGYGAYTYYEKSRSIKRRAQRASNGSRKEVVVICGTSGAPHDVYTKSIAEDLERRGFIVFVVVSGIDEEQVILNTGGRDLRPLHIDLLDPEAAQLSIEKFTNYLESPVVAFQGAAPHRLNFAGMVVVAASANSTTHRQPNAHPTGPVESIAAADWSDTLNLRLLSPFVTVQLFIRALRSNPGSRLLILTPAIVSALIPPFHAPEAAAIAAIDAFAVSLRRELSPLGVHVSQLKLGTFDLSQSGRLYSNGGNACAARADIGSWAPGVQTAYATQYTAQEGASSGKIMQGSSLKGLHVAVFDALTQEKPKKLVRVGRGSCVYEVVGWCAPDALVLWMLGSGKKASVPGESMGRSTNDGSMEWEKV